MSNRLKNRLSKIKIERELGSPNIIAINLVPGCDEDLAKAEADAIAEYKKINSDVDLKGARIIRSSFI